MKLSKILGVAAVASMALLSVASPAFATTLETNGVTQSGEVELRASLKTGTSLLMRDTSGSFANTCTASNLIGKDSTSKTGTTVSGPVSALSFSGCTHEKVVVDTAGSISIERIGTTTNGTLSSNGAKITVPVTIMGSPITVTCITTNTDLGTLTGVSSGSTLIDVNAVVNCGSLMPSSRWEATYVLTNSSGGSHAVGVVG